MGEDDSILPLTHCYSYNDELVLIRDSMQVKFSLAEADESQPNFYLIIMLSLTTIFNTHHGVSLSPLFVWHIIKLYVLLPRTTPEKLLPLSTPDRFLLENGGRELLQSVNTDMWSPLMIACDAGSFETTQALVRTDWEATARVTSRTS